MTKIMILKNTIMIIKIDYNVITLITIISSNSININQNNDMKE